MKRLGAKLSWKPFGIVEEVIDPQGEGRAEVVGMEIGAHNHSLLTGGGGNDKRKTSQTQRMSLEAQEEVQEIPGVDGLHDSHVPSDVDIAQSDTVGP